MTEVAETDQRSPRRPGEVGRQLRALIRASHPLQGAALALLTGVVAWLAGREPAGALIAAIGIWVVQAIAGVDNDLADAERDRRNHLPNKPVATGALPADNARFALICLGLVAIPLGLQQGWVAALCLLALVGLAWAYNHRLRASAFSVLPWAVSGAVWVGYLSYGGGGLTDLGRAPSVRVALAAAALAVCVHLGTSLPDLVGDRASGVRHLPLRIALKIGAPRLMLLTLALTALTLGWMAVLAGWVGPERFRG